MKRKYFDHFNIAGFTYYDGALAFKKLKIGTRLTLRPEPENKYDDNAIAVYYKDFKLGFVPRKDNRQLAAVLKVTPGIFDARVQTLSPDQYPENQVGVVVHVVEQGEVFID